MSYNSCHFFWEDAPAFIQNCWCSVACFEPDPGAGFVGWLSYVYTCLSIFVSMYVYIWGRIICLHLLVANVRVRWYIPYNTVYIRIYTHTRKYIYTCTHTYNTHTHVYIYTKISTHTYIYICILCLLSCRCGHAQSYVYVDRHAHAHMYAYIALWIESITSMNAYIHLQYMLVYKVFICLFVCLTVCLSCLIYRSMHTSGGSNDCCLRQ